MHACQAATADATHAAPDQQHPVCRCNKHTQQLGGMRACTDTACSLVRSAGPPKESRRVRDPLVPGRE